MILKVENEATGGFVYYDIGNGKVRVDSDKWAIRVLNTTGPEYQITEYEEVSDEVHPLRPLVSSNELIYGELFYDFSKLCRLDAWSDKNPPMERLKIVMIAPSDVSDDWEHTIVLPRHRSIFLLNNEGKTIDRL